MVQSFFYWFDRKWSLDLRFSSFQDIRRKAGEQNEPSNTVDDPGYGCNRNTQHGFCHVSLLTLCFLEGMCPMIYNLHFEQKIQLEKWHILTIIMYR